MGVPAAVQGWLGQPRLEGMLWLASGFCSSPSGAGFLPRPSLLCSFRAVWPLPYLGLWAQSLTLLSE